MNTYFIQCTKTSSALHKNIFFLYIAHKKCMLLFMNTAQFPSSEAHIRAFVHQAIATLGGVAPLAELAQVSVRTVYAWKKGERFPHRANIQRIADHLAALQENAVGQRTESNLTAVSSTANTFACVNAQRGASQGGMLQAEQGFYGNIAQKQHFSGVSSAAVYEEGAPYCDGVSSIYSGGNVGGGIGGTARGFADGSADFAGDAEAGALGDTLGMTPSGAHQSAAPLVGMPNVDEFIFVPKTAARPSAGGGSWQTDGATGETHAFRLNWILSMTHDTESLLLMEVMGRSMEPTLHNGDLVLVNKHETQLCEDRIYVVRVQDEIYIKRYTRMPGCIFFRGDNRELAYQDIKLDPHDQSYDWAVIGRVLWAGKKL